MELIVKNSNIKNADGFLFGLKGFSTESSLVSLDELESMDCSKVFISLDKNMFNEDLDDLEDVLVSLDKFSLRGVLFYDLSVLSIVKRLGLKLNLIWNQNFLVTNYKTCNFYLEEGVWGASVSSEITIDEIEELASNTKLNLMVNIFGYQLMAFSKRKLVSSYFDYIDDFNKLDLNYMKEKDNSYPVIEGDLGTKFLSSYILCGLRYINRLKNCGIKYLILDGNLIDDDVFVNIYNIFSSALDSSDVELLSLEGKVNSLIDTSLGFFDKKTIYKVKAK